MSRYTAANNELDRAGNTGVMTGAASGVVQSTTTGEWWSEEEANLWTSWAAAFNDYNYSFNNPYFDYFFTGQDVQITIDGLDTNEDLLPFYSFAYNIQQIKQPIYGFWDYTYSAMLRGTRIVTGAFSLVSTTPYLLTQQIAKAADIRSKSAQGKTANIHAIRGLDEDEALLNTYWRRNMDSNLASGQQHLFSVHPPFNMMLRYGLQQTSLIHESPAYRANEMKQIIQGKDNYGVLLDDFNERLIKNPFGETEMLVLIENVEIMSKQVEFDVEGNPLLETYTFMARDEVLLRPIPTSQLEVAPDKSPNPNIYQNNTNNPDVRSDKIKTGLNSFVT